jgi:hypothetical protein
MVHILSLRPDSEAGDLGTDDLDNELLSAFEEESDLASFRLQVKRSLTTRMLMSSNSWLFTIHLHLLLE